jgi:hypothetical protein
MTLGERLKISQVQGESVWETGEDLASYFVDEIKRNSDKVYCSCKEAKQKAASGTNCPVSDLLLQLTQQLWIFSWSPGLL